MTTPLGVPSTGQAEPTSRGSVDSAPSRRERLALALLLAVAAALRLREAAATPLWTDEIITLWVARMPLPELFRAVAADVHPPLHFLLVKGWRAIGGESSLWIKSLSVVFGVALVALVWRAGTALFGRAAGWIAATLLTVHGAHLYVSQESRFYSLLWLWFVGASWAAWRWAEGGTRRDAAALVACLIGGLYTHYLSLIVFGFLFLWGLLVPGRRPRARAAWVALFALAGLAFLPQLPTFLHQLATNSTAHWLRAPDLRNLVDLARKVSFLALYLTPLLAVLCALPLLRASQRRAATLLAAVSLGPVLLCWVLTRAGMHVFTERYMLFAVPFVCLLAAGGLVAPVGDAGAASTAARAARAATLVVLLAAGLRTALIRTPFPEAAEQRAAGDWLAAHAAPGDTIWLADIHSLFFLAHHRPALGVQRLVWWSEDVPYYEGGGLIPRAWIVPGAAFDTLATAGRWWGMNTEQGGTRPAPTLRRFDALGERVGPRLELVTLWRRPRNGVAPAGAP